MAKEKLNDSKKKTLDLLYQGGAQVKHLADLAGVSLSTAYKGIREGKLLNEIDSLKQTIREMQIQDILKDSMGRKHRSRH